MLKFIETEEEALLVKEYCSNSSFGLSVASMLTAYPPQTQLSKCWMQITDDAITAALFCSNGEIVLESSFSADYEELANFLKSLGYGSILCRARDVVCLDIFACGCGQVFRRETLKTSDVLYSHPETTDDFRAVFDLLELKGDFGVWFTDIAHRINSGTADMRVIKKDGKIISTASLLHIDGDRALLGAVATDKEYRGQGLASELINSFECKVIYLRCLPVLNSFYEKLGFKSVDVWAEIR